MKKYTPQQNQPTGNLQTRPSRTYEDWQADQQADVRTPEERGIRIGSTVMWRHRVDRIITTERATVLAIETNTLTLQVKDVQPRTCTADVSEIVDNISEHSSGLDAKRRAYYANQIETGQKAEAKSSADDTPADGSLIVR
jgi:hypothetical protein